MNILIVNDDGIQAEGIRHLAKAAKAFGDVYVVAPEWQCSAMSHRITLFEPLVVKKQEFPVEGVTAYSVSGTPADCVKIGVLEVLPVKPDIVFSGINAGYNTGIDILYSGTVAAAMEALIHGIPAIAFSVEMNCVYDVVEAKIGGIIESLLKRKIATNEIWNVNFPGCTLTEFKGILEDRVPAKQEFYTANYCKEYDENGNEKYISDGIPVKDGDKGTDIKAVLDRYISVGKIKNTIL